MRLKLLRLLFPKIYWEYLNLKTYSEFTKWVKDNPDKLVPTAKYRVPTAKYSSVCPHWLLHLTVNQKQNDKQLIKK